MIILPLTLGLILLVFGCRFGWAGLTRLAELRLRGGPLVFLAGMLQIVSVLTQQHRMALLVATAVLLAGFCWLNRRRAGLVLVVLGVTLNLTVMAANGGTMPINQASLASLGAPPFAPGTPLQFSKNRVMDDAAARLAWLGDRLLLPGPLARLAAWSFGDLLLLAGVGRLLWQTMKGQAHVDRTLWRRGALPRA